MSHDVSIYNVLYTYSEAFFIDVQHTVCEVKWLGCTVKYVYVSRLYILDNLQSVPETISGLLKLWLIIWFIYTVSQKMHQL